MEGNIYKPRYKIAFLSKNKIWSYKDSRLRRFFNIRGRKLVRRGLFKRYSIVFNNMKWTIARRFIRPFMRRRKGVKRKYRTAFYNKQQLRNFYGKCKEEAFRNFFKAHLSGISRRNDSFYSALERRADMFLFRTRLLPTIYAANQYVRHQGILLNYGLEKSPNALVRPGYLLTIQPNYWSIFAEVLEQRLFYRWHAYGLLEKRAFSRLKKKLRWISKVRKYQVKKEKRVLKKLYLIKRKLVPLKKILLSEYKKRISEWEKLYWLKIINLKNSTISTSNSQSKAFINIFDQFREELATGGSFLFGNEKRSSNPKIIEKRTIYKPWSNKFLKNDTNNNLFLRTSQKGIICLPMRRIKPIWSKGSARTLILAGESKEFSETKQIGMKSKPKVKSYWRGSESLFFRKLIDIFSFYKKFLNTFGKLKIMELEYKLFLINKIVQISKTSNSKMILKSIKEPVTTYIQNIQQNIDAYSIYLNEYAESLIKRRLKYRRWKIWSSFNSESGETIKTLRKTPLYYFIMRKRRKAKRRLSIPRLKGVHWFVPNYIHFDFKTMQSVFLYHPLADEIHYSFKASLPKLLSFYRSR